ncbi:MAG: AMP-binding protein [Bacteriovoracaceae bacterium]|nr:AMP-binding protein [Bacteriovoracaceae bacterium]
MFELDLYSDENLYLFSPKLDQEKISTLKEHLRQLNLKGHVFILSSGTSSKGELKGYAISKKALELNAKTVNEHLDLGPNDKWFLSLPPWHIGGLSVYARASVAGAEVVADDSRWDVNEWVKKVSNVQVSSIVPLQAYDIVKNKLHAPESLKFIIVGGDFLASSLHKKLLDLGWPILRTFGMTEVCSQLATEVCVSDEPQMKVLACHNVKVDTDGKLFIKTDALFTGVFHFDSEFSFKLAETDNGYFETNDLVALEGDILRPLSRADYAFKCKGRLFFLNELRDLLDNYAMEHGWYSKLALELVDLVREGKALKIIASSELKDSQNLIEEELSTLFAPAIVDRVIFVDGIERTELGKLKKH